jgi:hypothetical protein
MLNSSSYKFVAGGLMACLTVVSQAQGVDTRWRLRVVDLKHQVKVVATIRFAGEAAAESCMGGKWNRIVVETRTKQDEAFFHLDEPLAYELERGALTLGRTTICDGYALLSGKSDASNIHGTYNAVSMGGSHKLGYFSLKKVQ